MTIKSVLSLLGAAAVAALAVSGAVGAPIHDAAKAGDVAKLDAILKMDKSLVNIRDSEHKGELSVVGEEWSALHWAAYSGHTAAVKLLVDKGADVRIRDAYGFTPLHYALNKEIVEILVDQRADINSRSQSNGWTPLQRACFAGQLEVVKELLARGAKVDAEDRLGKSALHYAAGWPESPEITKLLLQHGANPNAQDHAGWTPLHNSSYAGHVAAVKLLLEKGAKVNAEDYYGLTPMMQARAAGRDDVVAVLKAAGGKG